MNLLTLIPLLFALLFDTWIQGQPKLDGQLPKSSNFSAITLPFDDARRMVVSIRIKHTFSTIGSAVWIGNQGYLATCYHVVKGANRPLVAALFHEPVFDQPRDFVIIGAGTTLDITLIGVRRKHGCRNTEGIVFANFSLPGKHRTRYCGNAQHSKRSGTQYCSA